MTASVAQQALVDLSGKIVLVTGGTSGLGRETVLTMADAGATV
ncbi:MAG: short-chain dehydrogenase, partial [Proteobacteria bacterium]|nr:short-chain dehydrogenase [Pseudomonadota bacterium]